MSFRPNRLPRPRWLLALAALLLIPAPAGALKGAPPPPLDVSTSLNGCEQRGEHLACAIELSWSEAAGADRYTATVRLANGTSVPLGEVGTAAGSTTVAVPYAGNGIYTLTVTAWGDDPEGKEAKIEQKAAKPAPAQATAPPRDPAPAAERTAGDDPPPAERPPEEPSGPRSEPEPRPGPTPEQSSPKPAPEQAERPGATEPQREARPSAEPDLAPANS